MNVLDIQAREILDSRGFPTLEVDLYLADGGSGRASVPSGKSTGSREAVEWRDKDSERYFGRGVQGAIRHIVMWVDVQHALEGFGADHVIRKTSLLSFSEHAPIVLEAALNGDVAGDVLE
ncbi:DUF190 domain-containing protein [Alicyclobacillus suci]|uniref:DUF190 domain-containing protein n=1 Tax=Alicyclobacillus suci TaxID=2816080 RepID=UPI001A8DD0B3|nr:DUF190 domain-containing protein [Alicyclobacillus suci]